MAEKKIIKAEDTASATKKKKKIIRADGTSVEATVAAPAKDRKCAVGYRIGAVISWLFAFAFELFAVLFLFEKIKWTFLPMLAFVIIALVLDLACVIVGSLLWKKANRIDPASEQNKLKFWLWNNMGVIVCAFAFIPFVILALTNKNADKKTKTVAVIVAIVACLIGGLCSYDWNPVSQEQKADAIEAFGDNDVFWTKAGTVYHLSEECSHLNHSEELIVGTVEQAIEANKTRLCKTCEAHAADYGYEIVDGLDTEEEKEIAQDIVSNTTDAETDK